MAEQTIDLIYGERVTRALEAEVRGDALWLKPDAIELATGWALKAEGFCKGETCVPVPAPRRGQFVTEGRYNLTALAELLGQPIIRDEANRAWCIGEAAGERRRALTSLDAPDFELPDLDGKIHRFADHRGKKILLVSWASW